MPPEHDIERWIGHESANLSHLKLLEAQFGTRAGIIPFVGAGLSAPFGLPTWGAFLNELAREAGVVDQTKARLDAAEYEEAAGNLLAALGTRRFQDLLAARFGDAALGGRRIEGAVAELVNLPPGPIITTNFDRVIETAYSQRGRRLTPYWNNQASKGTEALQQDRPFLLKLHGDWDDPTARVLTLEEYRGAYGDPTAEKIAFTRPLPTLLFKLLTSRCCLFLGCSLRQDRTIQLLRAIATGLPDLVHYAIVERPADDDAFHRRAGELSSQSIRPIWYPSGRHDLIQPLLAHLARRASEGLRALVANLTVQDARPAAPSNIPDLGNATIGRESEVATILHMARATRLITITGAGGCGKSRVAVEVAKASVTGFDHGVWFVPLADLASQANKEGVLPTRIAKIIGVTEQSGRPPHESLAEHLASGRWLLVLDNCEHLLSSCRSLVAYLLPRCPNLMILATSRRPLKVPQERLYPLAPLTTPDPDAPFEEIAETESVRLFVERARQRSPEWDLAPEQAADVARVCRAVAGIPLAIEVAAARLGVLTVESMAARSRDLLSALGNSRSGDLRSWTLKAALRWSYGLLEPPQQRFMRALTVFDGGWTAEAAAAVAGPIESTGDPEDAPDVLDMLQALLENSLMVSTDANGAKRFRYLEPIRQVVQLELSDDERALCGERHVEFFLAMAEEAAPHLLKADQAIWLDRLQLEVDNFRRDLRAAVASGDARRGLRLMAALWRFVEIRGFHTEGRMRGREILGIPGAERYPPNLSKVLSGVGVMAYRQADFDEAESCFRRSLEIETRLGNDPGIADALNDLGIVASMRGDLATARARYTESKAIEERIGNQRGVAVALYNLGINALNSGESESAETMLDDSLARFRAGGNHREAAFALNGLAEVYVAMGQLVLARERAGESLGLRQSVKDARGIADCQRTLAKAALESGDLRAADERLKKSIALSRGIGDKRGVSETLDVCALVCAKQSRFERAVELHGAADGIRGALKHVLAPVMQARRDAALDALRRSVAADVYTSAWRRGHAARFDDVVNSVLKDAAAVA